MAEKLGNTQTEVSGADKTHEIYGKEFAIAFAKDNARARKEFAGVLKKYRFEYTCSTIIDPDGNPHKCFLSFPAIQMDAEDEKKTASFGDSPEAKEYKEKQNKLFGQDKFREAVQMDIDDIHEKFGNKYDHAIANVLEYVDMFERRRPI